MPRLRVLVAVPLLAPVPVKVKGAVVCATLGVPLMTPVLGFSVRPAGRAGLMA